MEHRPHNTAAASSRQREIEHCLRDMMLHMPYEQVTVAKLCRQLGISRRTFYTYYPDKDTCLNKLIDRTIKSSMFHSFDSVLEPASLQQNCEQNFRFWKNQREFLEMLSVQQMFGTFRDRYVMQCASAEKALYDLLSTSEVEMDMDILYAFVNVRLGLLHRWYKRDFDTPPEVMAKKYIRILRDPLMPQVQTVDTNILSKLI